MTEQAPPDDEDVESTILGARRARSAAGAPDEDLESTVLGTRRVAAGTVAADEDIESTMLGIRRATQRRGIRSVPSDVGAAAGPHPGATPSQLGPELEIDELTTIQAGGDPAATAAAHLDDRTVLSSRRVPRGDSHARPDDTELGQRASAAGPRPVPTTTDAIELDPEATVFDVRHGGTWAAELPPGAHEDTVLTPRRSAAVEEERERTNPRFPQAPDDDTAIAPRIRRTPPAAPLTDSPVRPAYVPDALQRERYRKREIPQTPVYRTQPPPRQPQAPADGARAASQQRASGRRRLIAMTIIAGALVVVAIAAIVVLAVSMR